MRVAIIILVVLAAAYALFVVASASGAMRFQGFSAPDPNDPDAWTPPPMAASLGNLTAAFAPKADFGASTITAAPNQVVAREASPSTKTQLARLKIDGEGALGATYDCTSDDNKACPITFCLCSEGSPISPLLSSGCSAAFRGNVAGGVCVTDKSSGALPMYPDSRVVRFFSLGPQSVRAEL